MANDNDKKSGATVANPKARPALPAPAADDDVFVYVGPTLAGGRLTENAVFRGSRRRVNKHLAEVIADYPMIQRLLVSPNMVSAAKKQIAAGNNLLSAAYRALENTRKVN